MRSNRRKFLTATSAASTIFLTGCSGSDALGSNSPSFEIRELFRTDPELVSSEADSEQESFSATIQNTKAAGRIAVALFWQTQESGVEPNGVTSPGTTAYPKERLNEVYFDAGERRTVEFTARPPESAVGYLFLTQAATYGANIRNTGGDGRASVTLTYVEPQLGIETTKTDTLFIESQSTREITFNQIISPSSDWEIDVQQADTE